MRYALSNPGVTSWKLGLENAVGSVKGHPHSKEMFCSKMLFQLPCAFLCFQRCSVSSQSRHPSYVEQKLVVTVITFEVTLII